MEVRIIELLQDSHNQGPHAWVEIFDGEHSLTVRVDRTPLGANNEKMDGFAVYLCADIDNNQQGTGTETIVRFA